MPTAQVRSVMAIVGHGTGRGGTVGDDRTGRSAELKKLFRFRGCFERAMNATSLNCSLYTTRGRAARRAVNEYENVSNILNT